MSGVGGVCDGGIGVEVYHREMCEGRGWRGVCWKVGLYMGNSTLQNVHVE